MINTLGFIIALCTVTLQAEESRHNCSNYYLIIEETIFGHDLISLDAVDLNLLDPAIPRHCYLDLSCDSYIDSCPSRIVPTRRSTHIDVPDAPTVTKGYPELTHTESVVTELPRVSTTIRDTDETTPSVTPTVLEQITVTETPGVSTTTVSTTMRDTDETTSSVTPTVHDKVTVTEIPVISTTNKGTDETTSSGTPTVYEKVIVTETPRVSSTIRDIDETTPSITSTVHDKVIVTESPGVSTTARDAAETTSSGTPTVYHKVTVTETPRITTTIRDTNKTTSSVTSTAPKVTVTETPRVSTTTVTTTIRDKDETTPTATPTVLTVTATETLKPINTSSDTPKLNPTSTTEDTFNNEHLTRKNNTDNCNECLTSMLRNNAVSIIMVLVLLAIGVFACNTLCYVIFKWMGRCMNRSPVLCASNSYDVSKYE